MILINFSHPITEAQHAQLSEMLAHPVSLTVDIRSQIDMAQPIAPQVRAMVDSAALTPERWQSEQIVVNLPALNHSAGLVVAELHGRMGYMPAIVRLRPIAGAMPPKFEVAEIINLQAARDEARALR